MPSLATQAARTEEARRPVENPYLRGNFAPVDREQTLQRLQVIGELPRDLNGLLLRDGPNPAVPAPSDHWFVGDAMLHAIEFRDGAALSYRNRWVRTTSLQQSKGLAAAPLSPHLSALQGSGNVNVIHHAGRILALGEVGLPYELDRELNTLRQYDFDGALRSSMTAHPKLDPVTGEMLFFGYDLGPTHLRYHRVAADGSLTRTVAITTPRPTMIHDFGVTQTRIVFMDLPVVFDIELVARKSKMPFRWDDQHQARIGVMPRDGGDSDVRWIDIEPCYVYHPLNAYDDGDKIVMDVVRHERTFDLSRVGPEHSSVPVLCRWEIDPVAGRVTARVLDDRGQEFPRVDPRRETLRHRYGYATEALLEDGGGLGFGNLIKHDLVAGTREVHDVGSGRIASEGVFVPSGRGEDQGYVLAPVYDAVRDASDILVLDAQNFSKAPLATVRLPVRIPFGFHGNFADTSGRTFTRDA
jgi:carotenoid cleavage dioxygenase